MCNAPKVSIIIPIYNVAEYLRQCLDSTLAQTLRDIEIICVDDASTDNSPEILKEYALKDARIRPYFFKSSHSALGARKLGIEVSTGEYIMFLDADDYLSNNACEALYNKISLEKVDILHFSSEIDDYGGNSEARLDMNRKLLLPYKDRLSGEEVFNACFVKHLFGFTLWNKIYSAKLCKYAATQMEDAFFPKAQDLYSFFIIAYYAKSYYGWESTPYYHYCFGRGVTGTRKITLNVFERYCMQSRVINALKRFCNKIQDTTKEEVYSSIISQYQNRWSNECVNLWFNAIDDERRAQATEILFQNWGTDAVIQLTKKYWYARDNVAQKLTGAFPNLLGKKEIKTIALYYYHLTIGGVQRVISLLIPLLQKMGYKVVLITDKEPSENDLALEYCVERVTIFDYQKTSNKNYFLRLQNFQDIIQKYSIDLVIYHAWTSPLLLWDALFLKTNKIPVIIQSHSVFSYSLLSLGRDFAVLPKVISFCDGIVVLSEMDKLYWSHFNDHVYHIPNPISPALRCVEPTVGTQNLILWIGRFSNEKQPWEAIYIMEKVCQFVPDAMLYIIGNSQNASVLDKYQKMIDQRNLNENIKLLGYQQDVNQYLSKAKLTLITSTYEGFSMVLMESKAHGVPTVMYDLPYLDLASQNSGSICVPCNDRASASEKIVDILLNEEQWMSYHQQAYEYFMECAKYDYQSAWSKALNGDTTSCHPSDESKIMMNTILNHYMLGWNKNHQVLAKSKSIGSNRFGIIGWLIQKFIGGIHCYQEHGLEYTLNRVKEKFLGLLGR